MQDLKCESHSKEIVDEQGMGPPMTQGCQQKKFGKHSVKINKSRYFDKTPTNDDNECNLTPNRGPQQNKNMNTGSNKIDNADKCPSTISSYVGGFLNNIDKSDSAKGVRQKFQ